MAWATFWALVLGFGISAFLQSFVSRERMTKSFGSTNLKSIGIATGLGAASSSCSYAAVAAARSAIQRGAAIVPAFAFMFASTNLVIELGIILWILMGWQFVLAEALGAVFLIALSSILFLYLVPEKVKKSLREHAKGKAKNHPHNERRGGKWKVMAKAFFMDWQMMWKELVGGFLIAGFISTLVPNNWWETLFIHNESSTLQLIENALIGPLIALLSFVCSVGNIPLASHLWSKGISFGGVIAFQYGDLLVIPILIIYAKYYGRKAALWIFGVLYFTMVLTGIIVDTLFSVLNLVPSNGRSGSAIQHMKIEWNYTSWLDCAAAIVFIGLYILRRGSSHKVVSENG